MRVSGWRVAAAAGFALGAQMLTGCAGFFVPPSTTTSTSTSSTTDYAFVSNSASGSNYVNGYVVSSGTLVAATSSPASLSFTPQAMAVTPSNGYLYMVSETTGIYGYSVGTGGALTAINSGNLLASDSAASMAVSPDGNWLFTLETALSGASQTTINVYSINSGGTLSIHQSGITASTQLSGNPITPEQIRVAPSGEFIAVTLGTGGAEVYPFTTSSGTVGTGQGISPASASSGIYAVGIDSNNYMYLAGTILSGGGEGVVSLGVTSSGTLTNGATAVSSQSVGTGPVWIEVSSSSNYVYVANFTSSTISEFSTSSGVLTSLGTVNAPTNVGALGHDSSGSYLLALGYGSTSGTQIFAIGSTGTLTENNSAASGTSTSVPAAIAMSH